MFERKTMRELTCECVRLGHPDRLCDYIADRILDSILIRDPQAHAGIEVMAAGGVIFLAGEVNTVREYDPSYPAKYALAYAGYDPDDFDIFNFIQTQSPDINRAVGIDDAAGDQGIIYGYATNETPEMLPMPSVLARAICDYLDDSAVCLPGILPDGKAQVTVDYDANGKPERVTSIVVSVQTTPDLEQEELESWVCEKLIPAVFSKHNAAHLRPEAADIRVNPSGAFHYGGPGADTGLTGRKTAVETYGGAAHHGGGAISGKDPSKVDRSAAYMARFLAKKIVQSGLADQAEVGLAYCIGKAEPLSVTVNTFSNRCCLDELLAAEIARRADLTPRGIVKKFLLRAPWYGMTVESGPFSAKFPWEEEL